MGDTVSPGTAVARFDRDRLLVSEHLDAPNTCLLDNGGCDHFCEEEDGAQTPNCSCADGYFLHDDGMSCVAKGGKPGEWFARLF